MNVGSKFGEILDRETSGRISVTTIIDHYLRILDFLSEMLESLFKAEVNLFEAKQLARVRAGLPSLLQVDAKRNRA